MGNVRFIRGLDRTMGASEREIKVESRGEWSHDPAMASGPDHPATRVLPVIPALNSPVMIPSRQLSGLPEPLFHAEAKERLGRDGILALQTHGSGPPAEQPSRLAGHP